MQIYEGCCEVAVDLCGKEECNHYGDGCGLWWRCVDCDGDCCCCEFEVKACEFEMVTMICVVFRTLELCRLSSEVRWMSGVCDQLIEYLQLIHNYNLLNVWFAIKFTCYPQIVSFVIVTLCDVLLICDRDHKLRIIMSLNYLIRLCAIIFYQRSQNVTTWFWNSFTCLLFFKLYLKTFVIMNFTINQMDKLISTMSKT